jgi:hypothetical protein
MLRPLMEELCGGKKRPDKLEWSAAMDAAFAGAKQALLSATHLVHRTVGAELSVVVDALATHEGTCLQQQLPGKKEWQPLGFFSKKLEAAQQKNSAFDREFFFCYSAIFTNHKPLTTPWCECLIHGQHASLRSCPTWQIICWTFDIAGAVNVVADTHSRLPGH